MDDNPAMTVERKELLFSSLLPETREYQTKILGIRTRKAYAFKKKQYYNGKRVFLQYC